MGTPRKNSFHYDVYSQDFQAVNSSSGVLALTINYSWYDITLTENITSITTASDPGSTRAFSFSILVTQSSTTAYTIDWFSSGKFYSNLSAGDLQPPTTLGESARYTCVWDGTRYRVYIDSPYEVPSDPFQIKVETTAAAQTVPLPFLVGRSYDCTIDWGDGTITTAIAYNDPGVSHEYTTAGQYIISITGSMTAFSTFVFNAAFRPFLIEVISFGRGVMPYISELSFSGCTNLTTVVNEFNFSGSTYALFQGCTGLISLNLSNWSVSGLTDLSLFLSGCTGLTSLNVSGWNLSNLASLNQSFSGLTSLTTLDLSSWTITSTLTNLQNFLLGSSGLTTVNVTGWDTSGVTNMGGFAQDATSLAALIGISGWDTSSVTSLFFGFKGDTSLSTLDLSSWDMSSIAILQRPFTDANLSNLSIFTSIGTTTTTLDRVFENIDATSLDLSAWDTSNVTDLESVVISCSSLTVLNVSTWDISNVTNTGSLLLDTPINTASFDALLVGWTGWSGGAATKSVNNNLTIFSNLTSFTPGSDAADAANWLVTVKGWLIL